MSNEKLAQNLVGNLNILPPSTRQIWREIGCESVPSIHGGSGQGLTLRLNHRIVVQRRGETSYECVTRNWVTCVAFLLNSSSTETALSSNVMISLSNISMF
jgi:hypothetical protein